MRDFSPVTHSRTLDAPAQTPTAARASCQHRSSADTREMCFLSDTQRCWEAATKSRNYEAKNGSCKHFIVLRLEDTETGDKRGVDAGAAPSPSKAARPLRASEREVTRVHRLAQDDSEESRVRLLPLGPARCLLLTSARNRSFKRKP